MFQVAILSIIANLLAAAGLLAGSTDDRFQRLRTALESAGVRAGIAAGALAVGILKLFVRAPFDSVVVAGDLLPALAGLAGGTAILADLFAAREAGGETAGALQKTLATARLPIAVVAAAAAALHFLFPQAVIL